MTLKLAKNVRFLGIDIYLVCKRTMSEMKSRISSILKNRPSTTNTENDQVATLFNRILYV